ncbi:MAG: M56 family metallopeptidase, partial [Planctomycetaceae bacterium]|nr:M56 family metallopeptidase [Planctomycetaceae bacterium]
SDPLVSRLEELARRLGLRMRVNLLLSQLVEVPTLIGWLRPVILLPAAAVTGLTPSQLDAILVHELAHIRRHDYLVNLMQSAVETLLFYHPAVWWVSGRLRAERENCCDDLTVEILGDPINYGRALLMLEEQRGTGTNPALVLGSQGGSLLGRIERLVVRSNGRRRSTMGTSMSVLVGMLMLSCATMLMVRGEIHSERVVKDAEASDARVENQNEDSERSDSSDPISKLIEHEGIIWGPEKGGLRSALVIVPDKGVGGEFFDSHPLKKNWRVIQLIENVGKGPVQISNGPFDAELYLIDEKDESKRLVPFYLPHLVMYEYTLHPGRFDQIERMKLSIETLKEGENPLYQSEMGRFALSLPPGKYRLKLTAPGVAGLSAPEKKSATQAESLETVPLEFEVVEGERARSASEITGLESRVFSNGGEIPQNVVQRFEMIFFQDQERRTIPAVTFQLGDEFYAVMSAPATIPSDGVGHAIDRMFLKWHEGIDYEPKYQPKASTKEFFIYRPSSHRGEIPSLRPEQVIELTVGDRVSVAEIRGEKEIVQTINAARVSGVGKNAKIVFHDGKDSHLFENLTELDRRYMEGTAVFFDGKLGGFVVAGERFLPQGENRSLIVPGDRIVEKLRSLGLTNLEESLRDEHVSVDQPAQDRIDEDPQETDQGKNVSQIRFPNGDRIALKRVGDFPKSGRPWWSGTGEVLAEQPDSAWMFGSEWEKRQKQNDIRNFTKEFQLEIECREGTNFLPRDCSSITSSAGTHSKDTAKVNSTDETVKSRI